MTRPTRSADDVRLRHAGLCQRAVRPSGMPKRSDVFFTTVDALLRSLSPNPLLHPDSACSAQAPIDLYFDRDLLIDLLSASIRLMSNNLRRSRHLLDDEATASIRSEIARRKLFLKQLKLPNQPPDVYLSIYPASELD